MQVYVLIMIALVVAGTLFDIVHKGSARYFFEHWRRSKDQGATQDRGGRAGVDRGQDRPRGRPGVRRILQRARRVAHLLTMYGFLIYVVATAIMVFGYPTPAIPTPAAACRCVVDRRLDDLHRRLLVLVLHSGRCRRRGQLTP